MTTPLKALLQERLRAKIVRQGDDEDGPVGGADGVSRSVASPSPLLDTPKYLVPGKRSNQQDDAAAAIYRTPRHVRDDDEYRPRRYDTRPCQSGRTEPQDLRVASPVRVYSGSKRQWREPRDERSADCEDEPTYRHKRHTAREMQRSVRQSVSPPPAPVMPRKNYDLSSAYQRYREISSKRGYGSRGPAFATHHQDNRLEYEDMASSWPGERVRAEETSFFDDGYYQRPLRRDVPSDLDKQRPARWQSPTRPDVRVAPRVDTAVMDYDFSTDTLRTYGHGDGYPMHPVSPTYGHVAASSPPRGPRSPSVSTSFYDRYNDLPPCDDNRMVFHTIARVISAPRSPSRRQFLRQEDCEKDDIHDLDQGLSPESHQAAKDFVEKRQKRTSQGTPRTMAAQRWLQSMENAQHSGDDSDPVTSRHGRNHGEAYPPEKQTEKRDYMTYNGEEALAFVSKPTDVDRRRRFSQDAPLSPLYSPPRYAASQAFFSSAV